ncbi:spatzle 5 Toll-1 receptor isoform 1-T1 [Glossina fuscipes fuscipes]
MRNNLLHACMRYTNDSYTAVVLNKRETMKSIIRFIRSYIDFCLIYVILGFISFAVSTAISSPSCGLYGAPPCRFLPAPPGQTPSCARPGKTYCEHIDNYPILLIKHLVQKWGYEAKNLLVDETWDDFAAVAWHNTPVFYDPAYIFSQRNPNGNGQTFNGYNYEMSPFGSGDNMRNYNDDPSPLPRTSTTTTEGPTYLLYTSAGQRVSIKKNQVAAFDNNGKTTPNNRATWLKRIVRDLSKTYPTEIKVDSHLIIDNLKETNSYKLARDVSLNTDFLDIIGVDRSTQTRVKRQSPGQTSLCQTTSRFITPQAALNSKGNWMFVVNEASTARQMVKAELCASNTCSNLCQLPNNYNSRCEQKFVQKRLIALQGNGQNLYTDTFWFPSCCVCIISNN